MACATINVAASGDGMIDSLCAVTLGMSHTWVGDLTIKLVSPANTVVTLMSQPGTLEAADNGQASSSESSDINQSFPVRFVAMGIKSAEQMGNTLASTQIVCKDDAACDYTPNNGAAPAGDLSSFIGQPSAGAWKLCVGDSIGSDVGTIDRAALRISQ